MFNILVLLFGFLASPAVAQNVTCATRPTTDASNACASTAFVATRPLPYPTISTLGGVKSSTAPTNQFSIGIDTNGNVIYNQPIFTNIGGIISVTQAPIYGITRSQIPSTHFGTLQNFVSVGYSAFGDAGANCIYTQGSSSSTNAVQDADGNWWGLVTSNIINAGCFGALGSGSDYTTAIQAAINFAGSTNSGNGSTVALPAGTHVFTNLFMAKNVELAGAGKWATTLQSASTGDLLKMNSTPINSSVSAATVLRNMTLKGTNAANTGACYSDIGGTFVVIENVQIVGCKYGVILDQTELATIRLADFEAQVSGGASLWLVDGADHSPSLTFTGAVAAGSTTGTLTSNWSGATGTYNIVFVKSVGGAHEYRSATLTNGSTAVTWSPATTVAMNAATSYGLGQFTNRILVTESQFNQGSGVVCILDDGGVTHTFQHNNFNGCSTAIRIAGGVGVELFANEIESPAITAVSLQGTSGAGTGVGGSPHVTMRANTISMAGAVVPITAVSGANLVIDSNWFGGSSATKISGAGNIASIHINGNNVITGVLLDGLSTFLTGTDRTHMRLTVTQATSKSTGVTLNSALSGVVTMNNAALASGATVSFTVTDNLIGGFGGANDVVSVSLVGGAATPGTYQVWTDSVGNGSFVVSVKNISGGSLSEALKISFNVLKG